MARHDEPSESNGAMAETTGAVAVVGVELVDFGRVMGEKYHLTVMIVAVELVDFELVKIERLMLLHLGHLLYFLHFVH